MSDPHTHRLAAIANRAYLEDLYQQWRNAPRSLDEEWQAFFQGYELAREQLGRPNRNAAKASNESQHGQSTVDSLIYGYRSLGHLIAQTDPLGSNPADHPALALEAFGLSEADLDRVFVAGHLGGASARPTLRDILEILRGTYCGTIGVEYTHIQDRGIRRWLQQQMEPTHNSAALSAERRREILSQLIDAELFESFTHARYPGQKRFSLEGGESLIPAVHALLTLSPALGVREVVIGMAHRGRLNVLANILGMSYEMIFSEFEGNFLPDSVQGDGDVKYHRGYSSTYRGPDGDVHISLTANPSHLEAVYPVVQGRVRAKQRQHNDTERRRQVLPLVLHGDAAFAGQGIVAETLNLSQLPGYRTGGTVHIVINNQIGFTTDPSEARSTRHATDVAKMIEAPVFHVNGDDPDAVVRVSELALRFRHEFGRDVVIDLVCYRRHGHNEGDDPAFTQPILYSKIKDRPPVRKLYTDRLCAESIITQAEGDEIASRFRDVLSSAHNRAKRRNPTLEVQAFDKLWKGLGQDFSFDVVETGVALPQLQAVASALCAVPEGFRLNPKVARQLPRRREAITGEGDIDWSFAEQLALGCLLAEGTPVRLSGQDSGRGTFSQRHAVWQDAQTGEEYVPLRHVGNDQARFCVYNSSLSEASVLGFEYGYAMTEPHMLIMWEAQFGDFANGAQVIIDQFITGSESKWHRDSSVVMLLPHGYEGQGPEHSSAYLERYLMACAENNVQVCYPSTPAQYFHLLRRQVMRAFRLPLVVMTPKSLLRSKDCLSPVSALTSGSFQEFLDDPQPPRKARRLLLCSGKIFYELVARRRAEAIEDVAILRIEQLYPLHLEKLQALLSPLPWRGTGGLGAGRTAKPRRLDLHLSTTA